MRELGPSVRLVFFAGLVAHYLTDNREHEILWFVGAWAGLLGAVGLLGVGLKAWRAHRKPGSQE